MHKDALKFISGNNLTSDSVYRHRPFLFRNLDESLESHQRRLEAVSTNENEQYDIINKRPARLDRHTWIPPKPEVLREMTELSSRILKINITRLRPETSADDTTQISLDPASSTRKRRKIIDLRCWVQLRVLSKANQDNPVHTANIGARLQGSQYDDEKFHFDLKLDMPFLISTDKLHLIDFDWNRDRKYKRRRDKHYAVVFDLLFKYSDDEKRVLSHIGIPMGGEESSLIARWAELPECPSQGIPLYARQQGGMKRTVPTGYVLDVNMRWGGKSHSLFDRTPAKQPHTPLTMFNKVKISATTEATQLPTPVATPTSERTAQLEYIFSTSSTLIMGYKCVLCSNREFQSLERLQHHFATWHCNHTEVFKVTEEYDEKENSRVRVIVDTEPRGRGARHRKPIIPDLWPPGQEEIWEAPTRPFDLARYVKGDRRWEDSGTNRRKRNHASGASHNSAATSSSLQLKPKPPEHVGELPRRDRKRYKVPAYPPNKVGKIKVGDKTVTTTLPRRWYSSLSYDQLDPGDELSDTDDDVEVQHLQPRREQKIEALPLSSEERIFLKDINNYMNEEDIRADIFLGDCFVRWVRTRRSLLKNSKIREAFERFLEGPLDLKYITEECYNWCIQNAREASHAQFNGKGLERRSIPDQVRHDSPESMPGSIPDSIDAMDIDGQEDSTAVTASESRTGKRGRAGHCSYCGQLAEDMRTSIICTNPNCAYPEYHRICVGLDLEENGINWLCQLCR